MVVPDENIDHPIWSALPMTIVTAIVSPIARPNPRMMPPISPERQYGSTTRLSVSHRVAPNASIDSF